MSIYKIMEEDWQIYCLMAGIAIIEEFTKPKLGIKRVKNAKGEDKKYFSYKSIRLKMKNKTTIDWWFKVTKQWEEKKNTKFIEKDQPGIDNDQYTIHFNSNWGYQVLKEVKDFPSDFTTKCYLDKVKNWRTSGGKYFVPKEEISVLKKENSLYTKLFQNKFLAAGAFILSFDLECRGCQAGRLDLTMSDKYKDFLEFMLKLANHYSWATKNNLTPISVEYSINRGIKATPQFCFRIKTSYLKEIYDLAGPLLDLHKDKCLKHHIQRSKNYQNKGYKMLAINNSREKLLEAVNNLGNSTTTELQFFVNIGQDVITNHLNALVNEGKIEKERVGKRYIWSKKNANQCKT